MNIFRWKILSYSFARHHKITTLPNRVIRSRYGGRVIDDARFLGTVRKTSTDATVALLWSQRFQDGAVRRIATVASGEHAGERAFQTLQVFDLAPDIAAMRVGHVGNLAAGVGALSTIAIRLRTSSSEKPSSRRRRTKRNRVLSAFE